MWSGHRPPPGLQSCTPTTRRRSAKAIPAKSGAIIRSWAAATLDWAQFRRPIIYIRMAAPAGRTLQDRSNNGYFDDTATPTEVRVKGDLFQFVVG